MPLLLFRKEHGSILRISFLPCFGKLGRLLDRHAVMLETTLIKWGFVKDHFFCTAISYVTIFMHASRHIKALKDPLYVDATYYLYFLTLTAGCQSSKIAARSPPGFGDTLSFFKKGILQRSFWVPHFFLFCPLSASKKKKRFICQISPRKEKL